MGLLLGLFCLSAAVLLATGTAAAAASQEKAPKLAADRGAGDVEAAILQATAAAAAGAPQQQAEESYQRVYEAFTKLMDNVSNNSLGNVRRLVSRLNQLVGGPTGQPAPAAIAESTTSSNANGNGKREQQSLSEEEKRTEQILNRLDGVNKSTDQHTLSQLNEDVSRLVGTLSDSYLRNIRRVIERVNRVVGRPALVAPPAAVAAAAKPAASASASASASVLHHEPAESRQNMNGNEDDPNRQPGFPGWDELIVAVDRVQKSLASFVRSSTKLITAGRRR